MTSATHKYLDKLSKLKLTQEAAFVSYDQAADDGMLMDILKELNTPLLFFAKPAEPFFTAINTLARNGEFTPNDSETRTFLHSIPVLDYFSTEAAVEALKHRKAVWVKNKGVLTSAPFGAEQAFIFFSSVCFSGFVKFFSDAGGRAVRREKYDKNLVRLLFSSYLDFIPKMPTPSFSTDIFDSPASITEAMVSAGKAVVDMGLVDSFFGNISVLDKGSIYISRTGSSLDELKNEIDICPLDESKCTGLTASSELASHRKIYDITGSRVVLHAHPRFSVILSMMCAEKCREEEKCHYACEKQRFFGNVPIVSGEVGNGARAMVNTMPPAIKAHNSAIVYGHGVFTVSDKDFNEAFARLTSIESEALNLYHHLAC